MNGGKLSLAASAEPPPRDREKMKTIPDRIYIGAVLYTGCIGCTEWWIVDAISAAGFASLAKLKWSEDLANEKGVMRRTDDPPIRRKVKNDYLWDREHGSFSPVIEPITVKP